MAGNSNWECPTWNKGHPHGKKQNGVCSRYLSPSLDIKFRFLDTFSFFNEKLFLGFFTNMKVILQLWCYLAFWNFHYINFSWGLSRFWNLYHYYKEEGYKLKVHGSLGGPFAAHQNSSSIVFLHSFVLERLLHVLITFDVQKFFGVRRFKMWKCSCTRMVHDFHRYFHFFVKLRKIVQLYFINST